MASLYEIGELNLNSGGTAGAQKIVYAGGAIDINNSELTVGSGVTMRSIVRQIGNAGAPCYFKTIQSTNNSGKDWRCGHTGAVAGFTGFEIQNETDNVTPFSITAGGAVTVGPSSGFTGFHTIRNSATGTTTPDTTLLIENTNGSAQVYLSAPNITDADCEYYMICQGTNVGAITYEKANSRIYAWNQTRKSGPYVAANGTSWTTNTSDERFKEDFIPIEDAISKIKQIRAAHWKYKDNRDDGKRHSGLIAQDLLAAGYPYPVENSDLNKLSITYDEIHALYIAAIQELNSKIEALEARLV